MDEFILAQNGWAIYLALFLLLMGGAIGLPFPEDIVLIVAGILAHEARGRLEIIFLVCYLSIILGDVLIFYIGRRFGTALFDKSWFRSRISPARIRQIRKGLETRSLIMIFIARHLWYFRTVTFLVCGAVNMRFQRFLVADLLAAIISVPLTMWLGYLGTAHYDAISGVVKEAKFLIASAIIFGIGFWAYLAIRKRRLARENMPSTDPDL